MDTDPAAPPQQSDREDGVRHTLGLFARRVVLVAGVAGAVFVLWQIASALLLAFAGLLLAVFLRGLARNLHKRTPIPERGALILTLVVLAALLGGGLYVAGPALAAKLHDLVSAVPASVEALRQQLHDYAWGRYLLENTAIPTSLPGPGSVVTRVTGMASRALGLLTNALIILFIGLFFAWNPGMYIEGVLKLMPERHVEPVREALKITSTALWRWLQGKLVAMLFVGILAALGLQLAGVPLALLLGIIAGLSDFVPYIGPAVAAVLGILMGLTVSPETALYAGLVYFVVQQIEGNLLTPIVQRRATSLPPVLVLVAVVAFGLLFGILGVIVAAPLTVALLVLVKVLYVQHTLGRPVQVFRS